MKIDFNNLPIRDIEGNLKPRGIAKELGNLIYSETSDLGELYIAMRIYKEGCTELTNEEVDIVRKYIFKGFKAFVQKAFEDACKEGTE